MVARWFQASTYLGLMAMTAPKSFSARSKLLSSDAAFTRLMSRLQVSLLDTVHTAQMRSSIALALSSSGAIFNASNNVSSLMDGSPCPDLGRLLGGWIHSCRCGFCAAAGHASAK